MGDTLRVPNLEIEEEDDQRTQDQDATEIDETEGQGGPDDDQQQDDEQAGDGRKRITVPDLSEDDSKEILETLRSSGVNRENLPNVVTQAQAYNRLLEMLQTNPRQFVQTIEKINPRAAARLLEDVTEEYIDRYDTSDDQDDKRGRGNRGRGSNSNGRMPREFNQLVELVNGIKTRLDTQDQQAAYENLRGSFAGKLDQYFNAGDLKELDAKDKKALKALVKESLAEDPRAYANVQRGNFTDIPRHLQKVLDDWTADHTGGATEESERRETVRKGSQKTVQPGASNEDGVSRSDTERMPGGDDIWEGAVQELARDLNRGKAQARARASKK